MGKYGLDKQSVVNAWRVFVNYTPNNFISGPSQLTTEALAKHDKADDGDEDMDSDTRSEGGLSAKTFNTWASNYTDCTNATFSKVHRFWGSSTALHKEVKHSVR